MLKPLIPLAALSLLTVALLVPANAQTQRKVSYKTQIAPILKKNCVSCHSPKTRSGGLDLSTAAAIKKGGESKPLYVAKKSKDSRLVKHLNAEKGFDQMPPFEKLKPAEIKLIAQWLDEGPVFDSN